MATYQESSKILDQNHKSFATLESVVVDIHHVPPDVIISKTPPSTSKSTVDFCKNSLYNQTYLDNSKNEYFSKEIHYSKASEYPLTIGDKANALVNSVLCEKSYSCPHFEKIKNMNHIITPRQKFCEKIYTDSSNKKSFKSGIKILANNDDIECLDIKANKNICKNSSEEEEADLESKYFEPKYLSANLAFNLSSDYGGNTALTTSAIKTSTLLCEKFVENSKMKNGTYFSSFDGGLHKVISKSCLDKENIISPQIVKNKPEFDDNFYEADVIGHLTPSSSTLSIPICRICQLESTEPNNNMISPCKCFGSIKYVHNHCLIKWFKVSGRHRKSHPHCEICLQQYMCHKKFILKNWTLPSCSIEDKILHFIFLICVIMMIISSTAVLISFKEETDNSLTELKSDKLPASERNGFICAILFFLSFLIAICAEVKSKETIYKLFCIFCRINNEWYFEEYENKDDLTED